MSVVTKFYGVSKKKIKDAETDQVTISVVDDDENVHQLLKDLAEDGYFKLLNAFAEPAKALQILPQNPPNVLFMDLRLPMISGIECAERLKTLLPGLNIVIFTGYLDGPSFFRSLMAGVNGFLAKPFTIEELMETINCVAQGEYVLGKVAVRYLAQLFRQFKIVAEQSTLTPREEQVLACVFQGMADKEIAANLGIGTATVHTHLHRLFEKLGVRSRKEAIDKFLRVATCPSIL
jgi:DNA-binding NarL/FixJ family response regulator